MSVVIPRISNLMGDNMMVSWSVIEACTSMYVVDVVMFFGVI